MCVSVCVCVCVCECVCVCVCVCERERERERERDGWTDRQTDQDGDKERRKTIQYSQCSAQRGKQIHTHTHTCMLAHMQDHTLISFPKVYHIINFKKVVSVEMIVLCAAENMRNHSIVTHISHPLSPPPSLFPSFSLCLRLCLCFSLS